MSLSSDSAVDCCCSEIAGATDQFISSLPAMFAGKVHFPKKQSFGDRLEILAERPNTPIGGEESAESDSTFLLVIASRNQNLSTRNPHVSIHPTSIKSLLVKMGLEATMIV